MQSLSPTTTISHELSKIRERIEALQLPQCAFAGIILADQSYEICLIGADHATIAHASLHDTSYDTLQTWLAESARHHNCKVIAAGISTNDNASSVMSRLWRELDIVPYNFNSHDGETVSLETLAKRAAADFDESGIVKIHLSPTNEVLPSELVTLRDYFETCSTDEQQSLLALAREFRGKRLVFFSATPRGGGVALMRHALIRLYRLLGVDAHWHVLKELPEAFDITKTKFHNVLQAVSDPSVKLTEEDKATYNSWIKENAELFMPVFESADVVVIDDPQPSGLVPYIRSVNPKVRVLFRSHIQVVAALANAPGTPQYTTWQFIWNNIKSADGFISHPLPEFVPQEVPREKLVYMPATTDPLDGLNKELNEDQQRYYLEQFNQILLEHGQEPLDLARPYIIQIARFDPSKGIPDVIESYRLLRERLGDAAVLPQLVICGHGSIDDPDGVPIYNLITELLATPEYQQIAHDIKVARLPHSDQILNALLRGSTVVLQLSHKEGFEIKATEALLKGKPVLIYRSGGLPLQVVDGHSGYILPTGDTAAVAEKLYELLTNPAHYRTMSENASRLARRDLLTVPNAINWLLLANEALRMGSIDGRGRDIRVIASGYVSRSAV